MQILRPHMSATPQVMIDRMKKAGRFRPEPAYKSEDLDQWEKDHSMKLPQSFRTVLTAGSYEIANFYFHPLKQVSEFPDYVQFARWNDEEFAFYTGDSESDDRAVFVLQSGSSPFKRYSSFSEWFQSVTELTSQSNNPE